MDNCRHLDSHGERLREWRAIWPAESSRSAAAASFAFAAMASSGAAPRLARSYRCSSGCLSGLSASEVIVFLSWILIFFCFIIISYFLLFYHHFLIPSVLSSLLIFFCFIFFFVLSSSSSASLFGYVFLLVIPSVVIFLSLLSFFHSSSVFIFDLFVLFICSSFVIYCLYWLSLVYIGFLSCSVFLYIPVYFVSIAYSASSSLLAFPSFILLFHLCLPTHSFWLSISVHFFFLYSLSPLPSSGRLKMHLLVCLFLFHKHCPSSLVYLFHRENAAFFKKPFEHKLIQN